MFLAKSCSGLFFACSQSFFFPVSGLPCLSVSYEKVYEKVYFFHYKKWHEHVQTDAE